MNLDDVKNALPEYAKDLKLNLSSVLDPAGAPGLSEAQIAGTALASALAARSPALAGALRAWAAGRADEATLRAAGAAAAIMGMNNIYYRAVHLMENTAYGAMPARLRMTVIANPGVPATDFELYSLAASAVNGCGACLDAHEKQLRRHGVGEDAVHSALRIAAVVHAVAAVLDSDQAETLSKAA